ncbi:MAG: PH domain-containing protein [Candidatus Pacebacteria bacterium]|nr:PH domain-containing protein [Candidatus Paceibacterota bacterium]
MQITEGVIQQMHSHFLHYLGFYFFGILIAVLGVFFFWQGIFLGILIFILGEIVRRAETFYVLETGVARGYHLLSTSRKFVEFEKIQNVEVNQSFLENILGIGSLEFDTSGSHDIEIRFIAVSNPYKVEKIVREKMALK